MLETLLLTGFGPFGSHERNISQEAAAELDGLEIDGFRVRALSLPVQLEQATALLEEALADRPAAVVATGIYDVEPGEDPAIRVEVAARNEQDYPIPDDSGQRLKGPILRDGPEMAYATLPVGAIKLALDGLGVATQLSEDAGRYLCNAVFYWLSQRHERVGFLHLPSDPAGLEEVVRALRVSLETTAARLQSERVEATTS